MAMRSFTQQMDTAPSRPDRSPAIGRVPFRGGLRASSPAKRRLASFLAAMASLALAAALSGCATFGVAPFPEPIRPPIESEGEDTPAPPSEAEEDGRYSPTPGVRITRTEARGAADELGADLEGPPIKAAFNGVPIVPFINEVFGTQLGMSFVISPGLQEKQDLVTLRLTSAVPPRQFFSTVRQVLTGNADMKLLPLDKFASV